MWTRLLIRPRTVSLPSRTVLNLEALDLRNAPSSLIDPVHDLSSHPSAAGRSADTRTVSSTASDLDALPKTGASASNATTIDPSLTTASPNKKHQTGDAGGTTAAPSTHAKASPAATTAHDKEPATKPTPAIPVKASGAAAHKQLSSTPSGTKGGTATAMEDPNNGNQGAGQGGQAPQITDFTGVEGTGGVLWTFSGIVTATNPAGLTVTFGGIPDLQGVTATTDANGNFSEVVQLQTDGSDNGTATSVTTYQGLQSNTACFYVSAS